eukprot:scaffold161074_cov32-Tisochrysis_lutea.AAC.2
MARLAWTARTPPHLRERATHGGRPVATAINWRIGVPRGEGPLSGHMVYGGGEPNGLPGPCSSQFPHVKIGTDCVPIFWPQGPYR